MSLRRQSELRVMVLYSSLQMGCGTRTCAEDIAEATLLPELLAATPAIVRTASAGTADAAATI